MTSSTCSVHSDKPLRHGGAGFTCCLIETRSLLGATGGAGSWSAEEAAEGAWHYHWIPAFLAGRGLPATGDSAQRKRVISYLVSREGHDLPAYTNNKWSVERGTIYRLTPIINRQKIKVRSRGKYLAVQHTKLNTHRWCVLESTNE